VPIALLPELTRTLARAGRMLAPWSRLVLLEEQVLRRARGAFLVHWLGTSVPVRGLQLHVAIRNIDAFRQRYLAVERSMPGPATPLNLLGPLAGIGGLVVGMAMSPTGWVLVARYADEIADRLIGGTAGGILGLVYRLFGYALAPVLGLGLGLPVALAGAFAGVLGGGPAPRAVYELLGELAMLIDAVVRFWDVLTGPRGAVRNPLLRRILHVLDRFAGLFAQVLGFAAILVTRVARFVPHLVGEFRALGGLLDAVAAALSDIVGGIGDRLSAAFVEPPNPLSVLERVFDSFVELPGLVVAKVTELVEGATSELTLAFGAISAAIDAFVGTLSARLSAAFGETAVGLLVARVQRLLRLMPAVREAFAQAARRPPEEPGLIPIDPLGDLGSAIWRGTLYAITGGFTGSLNDLIESFGRIRFPSFPAVTPPGFPALPTIESLDAIMARIGRPTGLDATALTERLRAEADAALAERHVPAELLRDPTSAFALERRDLLASRGRPTLRLDDERLRDLIYLAAGRVLPPALRVYAPDVRALFDQIDREVYDIERPPLEHPMLELEDNGRLRPVVQMLTVRARGADAPDVRAFRDLLVEELRGRAYAAVQPA
jgi:hypothetical protein